MYKRLTVFTTSLTKCIYFFIIFLLFITLNSFQCFPIDNLHKTNRLNLVQTISIPVYKTNSYFNLTNNFTDHIPSLIIQRILMSNHQKSSRNVTTATLAARRRHSRRARRSTRRTTRISNDNHTHNNNNNNNRHHHRGVNRIVTTIYDPKQHRFLDPYEVDHHQSRINNELNTNALLTSPPSSTRLTMDRLQPPTNTPSITLPLQRYDTFKLEHIFDDDIYSANNRQARATNNHTTMNINHHQSRRNHHFCPGQDVATRAYLAPTVFEGKVRSMSSNKKPHYAVTFEVKVVYKNQSKFKPLVKNETIRLHFAHGRGTNCECLDYFTMQTNNNSGTTATSLQQTPSTDQQTASLNCGNLVKAHLRAGKTYILFVNRVGTHNYTVLGPPVGSSAKSVYAVLRVLNNPNSVKPANVNELNDVTLKWGKKLKLVCRTQGFPPPRVHWLKNGTDSFLKYRRVRIQHRRRQSTLIISKVKLEDAGRYECTARGVIGPPITKSAFVKVLNNTRENTSSADPHPCTEDRAQICMNGGTCMFFSSIGEYACQCANGFNGRRCDQKMPLITKTEEKMLIYTPTKLIPGL